MNFQVKDFGYSTKNMYTTGKQKLIPTKPDRKNWIAKAIATVVEKRVSSTVALYGNTLFSDSSDGSDSGDERRWDWKISISVTVATAATVYFFMEEVQKYDCIYNKYNKRYKDKYIKMNCWAIQWFFVYQMFVVGR